MKVYCIFCKAGTEDAVSQKIAVLEPNIDVIIPVRTIQEKRQGKWEFRRQQLIPGYIFLYIEEDMKFADIRRLNDVFRILEYGDHTRELAGSDYDYAMWLYRYSGNIETSTVMIEGSNVKVIDGPLKDGVGKIIKIDRHKRRARVEFDFYGNTHTVSLSIEDITSYTI